MNAFNMHGNPLGQVASNGNTFELYYSDILCESPNEFRRMDRTENGYAGPGTKIQLRNHPRVGRKTGRGHCATI